MKALGISLRARGLLAALALCALATPALRAGAAEVALYLGDAELGKRVAELMAPYAGEAVTVASMVVYGPVDLYLALASKAAGDEATASRHADRAAELCVAWQLVPVGAWLTQLRGEHGF